VINGDTGTPSFFPSVKKVHLSYKKEKKKKR
jgi:hypothetical protein